MCWPHMPKKCLAEEKYLRVNGKDEIDSGKNVWEEKAAQGAIPTLKHQVEEKELIKETGKVRGKCDVKKAKKVD